MINFVTELPAVLEPNSLYYIEGELGNATHYVSDSEGVAKQVTTVQIVQSYMGNLKGTANGYAELDGNLKLPLAQMPSGSSPTEISSAIDSVESSLQSNINQKADADSVYNKAQVDSLETGLQNQVNSKQATLSNAIDVAKLGDSSYDGKPIVLLTATQW
jgi:hypothetical protein